MSGADSFKEFLRRALQPSKNTLLHEEDLLSEAGYRFIRGNPLNLIQWGRTIFNPSPVGNYEATFPLKFDIFIDHIFVIAIGDDESPAFVYYFDHQKVVTSKPAFYVACGKNIP